MVTAMNLPFGFDDDYNDKELGFAGNTTTLAEKISANTEVVTPFIM